MLVGIARSFLACPRRFRGRGSRRIGRSRLVRRLRLRRGAATRLSGARIVLPRNALLLLFQHGIESPERLIQTLVERRAALVRSLRRGRLRRRRVIWRRRP